MDSNADVFEMQHGNDVDRPLRALKIVPLEWDKMRLQWLWQCLKTQDYAFDDFAEKAGAEAFVAQLFNPSNIWYELGDVGIACFTSVQENCSCMFHFALWDDNVTPAQLFGCLRVLFAAMYDTFNLRRITAMIPSNNKPAIRCASLNNFKYEGEMRKAFCKNGQWYNLHIYGLLREEFNRKEATH